MRISSFGNLKYPRDLKFRNLKFREIPVNFKVNKHIFEVHKKQTMRSKLQLSKYNSSSSDDP